MDDLGIVDVNDVELPCITYGTAMTINTSFTSAADAIVIDPTRFQVCDAIVVVTHHKALDVAEDIIVVIIASSAAIVGYFNLQVVIVTDQGQATVKVWFIITVFVAEFVDSSFAGVVDIVSVDDVVIATNDVVAVIDAGRPITISVIATLIIQNLATIWLYVN